MTCKDPDHMSMPVKCDCGEWCELQDMDSAEEDGILVCPECLQEWKDYIAKQKTGK